MKKERVTVLFVLLSFSQVLVMSGVRSAVAGTHFSSEDGSIAFGYTCEFGIAANPRTDRIYVANLDSGSVFVIDGSTNAVLDTILVGGFPVSVAVNPDTNRIFVVNRGSNSTLVIDGSTNTLLDNISVGRSPVSVAVNRNTNRIYVVNTDSGSISVIDGSTNRVSTEISAGTGLLAVAVNANTDKIYVTDHDSNSLLIIDGSTNQVETSKQLSSPWSMAVDPSANRIYVIKKGAGFDSLAVVDGSSLTIVVDIPLGQTLAGVAVDPDTGMVYAAGFSSGSIFIINGSTNQVVTDIPVAYAPSGVTTNPSKNEIYIGDERCNMISKIDGSTYATVATIPVPEFAISVPIVLLALFGCSQYTLRRNRLKSRSDR